MSDISYLGTVEALYHESSRLKCAALNSVNRVFVSARDSEVSGDILLSFGKGLVGIGYRQFSELDDSTFIYTQCCFEGFQSNLLHSLFITSDFLRSLILGVNRMVDVLNDNSGALNPSDLQESCSLSLCLVSNILHEIQGCDEWTSVCSQLEVPLLRLLRQRSTTLWTPQTSVLNQAMMHLINQLEIDSMEIVARLSDSLNVMLGEQKIVLDENTESILDHAVRAVTLSLNERSREGEDTLLCDSSAQTNDFPARRQLWLKFEQLLCRLLRAFVGGRISFGSPSPARNGRPLLTKLLVALLAKCDIVESRADSTISPGLIRLECAEASTFWNFASSSRDGEALVAGIFGSPSYVRFLCLLSTSRPNVYVSVTSALQRGDDARAVSFLASICTGHHPCHVGTFVGSRVFAQSLGKLSRIKSNDGAASDHCSTIRVCIAASEPSASLHGKVPSPIWRELWKAVGQMADTSESVLLVGTRNSPLLLLGTLVSRCAFDSALCKAVSASYRGISLATASCEISMPNVFIPEGAIPSLMTFLQSCTETSTVAAGLLVVRALLIFYSRCIPSSDPMLSSVLFGSIHKFGIQICTFLVDLANDEFSSASRSSSRDTLTVISCLLNHLSPQVDDPDSTRIASEWSNLQLSADFTVSNKKWLEAVGTPEEVAVN